MRKKRVRVPARGLLPAQEDELRRQKALIEAKRAEIKGQIEADLPHLYGFPHYKWSREFFNCTKKIGLLCAANQISKSSTQIRTVIDWATNKKKWAELWPTRQPRQFWYLYPSKNVSSVEFMLKWIPEFLPRGAMKDDPEFGWEAVYDNQGFIDSIAFKSGVHVFFRHYSQQATNLQSGTVDAIFCDEELPVSLWDELHQRLSASLGYFRMVFTATLNQEFWWKVIEGTGEDEKLPEAFKLQVSKYDCLTYEDGSPSPWTLERIKSEEANCKSEAERLRRIEGRFVTEVGRKYGHYAPLRHTVMQQAIPSDWLWIGVVDKGSGGPDKKNHFSAIVFIAVAPNFRKAIVVSAWRGDNEDTTCGDLFEKYVNMRERLGIKQMWLQIYDYAARDFYVVASRMSESFIMADKSHERGTDAVNTAFEADMLFLMEGTEMDKLSTEMLTLMRTTPKQKAKDDLCDCLRYGAVAIPWDAAYTQERIRDGAAKREQKQEIDTEPTKKQKFDREAYRIAKRLGEVGEPVVDSESWSDEFAFWNAQYGTG